MCGALFKQRVILKMELKGTLRNFLYYDVANNTKMLQKLDTQNAIFASDQRMELNEDLIFRLPLVNIVDLSSETYL